MKILVTATMAQNCLQQLEEAFGCVAYKPWTDNERGGGFSEKEILELLKKYQPDILITELDNVTEHVIRTYGNLKVIGDCRANPVNIDIETCNAMKIPVFCTPARNAQAVAELLVGMLINFHRNIQSSIQWVEDGNWKLGGDEPYGKFMGNELYGKKVGFVGFGAVGQKTAGILEAFGCQIFFYDPFVESVKESYRKTDMEYIFSHSDIITVHLPVLKSTIHMIGEDLLERMKPTAVFVNTARAAVVDTKALESILKSGKIRGAILDVLDHEPPTEEDLKIAELPNVLLTPHICGATYEVIDHHSIIMLERLMKWREGTDWEGVVFNKQMLS